MGRAVYLHYALLVLVQAAWAWVYLHTPWLRTAVLTPIAYRLLFWTLPVCLLVMASGHNPIDYFKLNKNVRTGVAWGVIVGLVLVAGNLFGTHFLHGRWHVNFRLGWSLWLGSILLVGLSEEVIFRGYYLQKMAEQRPFWKANVLQAALFSGIHVPGWLVYGKFGLPAWRQCTYVLFIALGLAYVFRKTNSLWACMVIHSLNNFASLSMPV